MIGRATRLFAATALAFAFLTGAAAAQSPADASQPDLVARGRYLATAADCGACHTAPRGGRPFAGGYGIDSPLGRIYSTNITPSRTAGIGSYTEAEFARAVREGIRADGTHLYPAMPYTSYARLSDVDVRALYAYFMRGVETVDEKSPETTLPFPFSLRLSMAAWNLLFLDGRRFQPDPTKSTQWNRGAYLAEALAHCSACHTPRNFLMAERRGGSLAGGPLGSWYAPNITSDPVSGIGGWSEDDLVRYLRTGDVPGKAQAGGPMAEAIEHSLQHLAEDDLRAIAVYLRDVPPVRSGADARPRHAYGAPAAIEASLRGASAGTAAGERIFSGSCASCHLPSGTGSSDHAYPSLFHNTATGAGNANNLVSAILFGVDRTVNGKHVFMPGFGRGSYVDELSDQEVAEVSNYVLTRFGNPQMRVTDADVATLRRGGPTPPIAQLGALALPGLVAAGLVLLALVVWRLGRKRRRRALA